MNFIDRGLNTYAALQSIDNNKEASAMRKEAFQQNKNDRVINQQRQAKQDKRADELYNRKVESFDFEKGKQEATFLLAKQAAARKAGVKYQPSDEELHIMQNNRLLNMDFLMSDEVGQALEVSERVKSDPSLAMTPEAAGALNLLSPEIQKGSAGKKSISRIMPAPKEGHLVFELDVDGVKKPMTEGRDISNPESVIKQVPMDDVIDRVNSVAQLRQLVTSDEGQAYLSSLYSELNGGEKEQKLSSLGQLYKERNALPEGSDQRRTYDRIINSKTKNGGAKPQGDPSIILAAKRYKQELKREGKEISFQEAFRITNSAKENPVRFVTDYVKSELKRQDEALISEGDEGYKDRDTITAEAIESLNSTRETLNQSPMSADEASQGISDHFQQSIKPQSKDSSLDDYLSNFL